MAKKITKLTKNAAFYLGKCIWRPLVKDFMPNHHPPSDHYPRALKVHCHAIQWFFVDFLWQKNGADPTEAAPDQTNRGASLVKIRASQSRDLACGNGSKGVEGLRYDLRCKGELKSSCTYFSHHLVLPRYQAFFLVLPLPGRHTTDRTLAQCRCEWPLRRSALVKSSSWRSPKQGSETGEASTGRSS